MSWPRDLRDEPPRRDVWGWPIYPSPPKPDRIDPNPNQDFEPIDPSELEDSDEAPNPL